MAEYVQIKLEKIIPQLEMLKAVGLYTDSEIRKIIFKLTSLEHKLSGLARSADNYFDYINYMLKIIELMRLRRKQKGIPTVKTKSIQFKLINKVNQKFLELLKFYGFEIDYWRKYILFATQFKLIISLSRAMNRLVEQHQRNPQVWKLVADYFLDRLKRPDKAQKLLLRGLQYNKGDIVLYCRLFEIEMVQAFPKSKKMPHKIQNKLPVKVDKKYNFARAYIIMEAGVTDCESEDEKFKLATSILKITEQFKGTWELQKKIVDYLMENFASNELMWDLMALKVLEGKQYEVRNAPKLTLNQKLNTCIQIYKNAIQILQTPEVWKLFLNRVLTYPVFKDETKLEVLEDAHKVSIELNEPLIDENHYLIFMGLSPENTERILQEAVQLLPESIVLWSELINYYIKKNEDAKLEESFHKAVAALKSHSLPIWDIRFDYYTERDSKFKKLCQMFEDSIKKYPGPIADHLVPKYLQWMADHCGVVRTRKLYHYLMNVWPCLGLYTRMFEIEFDSPLTNVKELKTTLEYGTLHSGKVSCEVWLNYVKFVKKYEPINLNLIFNRALATLKDNESKEVFKRQFEALRHCKY